MGKVCEPLDLITGWPSFGSNNLNHTSSVVADQTCTTVRRNFGPFLFTKLFQLSNILEMSGVNCSLEVMPQHLKSGWGQDSDWATSEGVISYFDNILLLIYICVLGRCPVHSPNFCWASIGGQRTLHSPAKCLVKLQNSFFPSMIASCPGPEAAKQLQPMMLPPSYFTVGMRLVFRAFFFSTHSVVCSFQTTQLYFKIFCPHNILEHPGALLRISHV